ncbi:hypothetical protein [Leuconostoc suionicum]|uniref:hypothetical protein n=1 Tax=Leuconostoc suionicum TaxID=1511761 RepID=UPI0021A27713|nr:hypothetical protein [Leuconostoc suionicum]
MKRQEQTQYLDRRKQMSELKPVAYKTIYEDGSWALEYEKSTIYDESIPLYKKEQLQPRVDMTKTEFDEFNTLVLKEYDLYSAINAIADTNLFPALYERLFGDLDKSKERQNKFAVLWASYNPLEPEETIEIVPDMKWFVRSKEPEEYEDEYYLFLSGSNLDDLDYLAFDYARAFDTKEEAEKWTNPLTEAVQLPVK